MRALAEYDRHKAVEYAHRWAFERNPRYYNYDKLGGDCTNYASQCIFAGSGVMNYTPTMGWYYSSANNKAPAWTGVPYLFGFLTRLRDTPGPRARECEISELLPGDVVQLSFDGEDFAHTPVVVAADRARRAEDVLVAAHTDNADYRPLSTYPYRLLRPLHIEGVIR